MPKCNCEHIDHCDFSCLNDYSIAEECNHPNKLTRVLETFGICETSVIECADCNEQLTKPKTDC
jgi:hypothetical protein